MCMRFCGTVLPILVLGTWSLVLGSVVIAFLCFGFSQRVNKFHIMSFITDP